VVSHAVGVGLGDDVGRPRVAVGAFTARDGGVSGGARFGTLKAATRQSRAVRDGAAVPRPRQ
jgi:hypothetical protein